MQGGRFYVFPMLPLGLTSAPEFLIWQLMWYVQQAGIYFIQHYWDDFIIVAPLNSGKCSQAAQTMDASGVQMGVPLAHA